MDQIMKEIEFGTNPENKKQGVFLALTANSKIYLDYDDPKMTMEYRNTSFPIAFMLSRWDNRVGFFGGFLDPTETNLKQVALREVKEEFGLELEERNLKAIVSHDIGSVVVHVFHHHLGELNREQIKSLMTNAYKNAKDIVSEGVPTIVYLEEGKCLDRFLNSNVLAPAVKEEMYLTIEEMLNY